MNFKSISKIATGLCLAVTAIAANAELQLACPLDWRSLSSIAGQNQDVEIYGIKARDWQTEHLEQFMMKEEECLQTSNLSADVKKANLNDTRARIYRFIEERSRRQQQEILRAQQVAAENQRNENQKQLELRQQREQQQNAERQAERDKSDNLWALFWVVAAVLGGWYWNKAIRNRCPNCKSTSFDRTNETETDRWRGTKQVTEKHSRGSNTRHVQTTYVMKQFEYCCKNCQHEWMKERQEEHGKSSPIGRFFAGY